jgi:hypothetical protein
MYTLSGNYKSDLVHVRDLLEPLAHRTGKDLMAGRL